MTNDAIRNPAPRGAASVRDHLRGSLRSRGWQARDPKDVTDRP